jgi:predicted phosphohydrolase
MPQLKLIQTTSWLDPRVRAELKREAESQGLSLSEVVAMACRDWVCYEIHRQQTTLFEAKQRRIFREELARLKDSLIPFELKTAVSSEQTRILVTDVYKRMLKAEGVTTERLYEVLDQSDAMAYDNIKARTPKFSALVNAWSEPSTATKAEGREVPN